MTASERLTLALVTMAAQGERPRCSDPVTREMWTSDREVDRAIAATWCQGCSIMVECGDAADELGETWYVFGGRDYGRRRKKKQAAA